MKKFIALLALVAFTLNSFAFDFQGFVTQTNGKCVSIEIISNDGDSTFYQCQESNALMGLKKRQFFNLNLEKDSHYTLVFTCENGQDKYVYVDTHNISTGNFFEVLMYEYDTIMYFEPVNNTPKPEYVERSYLEWMCENFPQVRDYSPQLIVIGEKEFICD